MSVDLENTTQRGYRPPFENQPVVKPLTTAPWEEFVPDLARFPSESADLPKQYPILGAPNPTEPVFTETELSEEDAVSHYARLASSPKREPRNIFEKWLEHSFGKSAYKSVKFSGSLYSKVWRFFATFFLSFGRYDRYNGYYMNQEAYDRSVNFLWSTTSTEGQKRCCDQMLGEGFMSDYYNGVDRDLFLPSLLCTLIFLPLFLLGQTKSAFLVALCHAIVRIVGVVGFIITMIRVARLYHRVSKVRADIHNGKRPPESLAYGVYYCYTQCLRKLGKFFFWMCNLFAIWIGSMVPLLYPVVITALLRAFAMMDI